MAKYSVARHCWSITNNFVAELEAFAAKNQIPLVHFEKGQRKDDIANSYRRQFSAQEGVVFIGIAQERTIGFKARKDQKGKAVLFFFSRQSVCVKHYYIYIQDADFGPGFIKIATDAPYPVKVCLNGHEWVKQQLRHAGINFFTALDNGFLHWSEPERLPELCQQLGPEQVQAFFDKWVARLPWPLTVADRQAGYQHRLAIPADGSQSHPRAPNVPRRDASFLSKSCARIWMRAALTACN